jgi:hypothetical protein
MPGLGGLVVALFGPGRRRAWRRRVLRRVVAALCAVTAVAGVLASVRAPASGPTVAVLVASQRLAVGQIPSGSAVHVVRWPQNLAPSDVLDSASRVAGRRLSAVLSAGEPVTEHRLSTSALLDGQPVGTVAVHVALADPSASAMVSAGDRVDLVGPGGTVARGVLVLRSDDFSGSSSGGLVPGAATSPRSVEPAGIVVAAGHESAEAIARAPVDALGRPSLTLLLRAG